MAPFSFRRTVSASQKDKQGEDQQHASLPLISRTESSMPEVPVDHNVFYGCFDVDGTITTSFNPVVSSPLTASFSSDASATDSTAAGGNNTTITTCLPRLSVHHATFKARVSAACFHYEPPDADQGRRTSSKSSAGHALLRGRHSGQSITSNTTTTTINNSNNNRADEQMLLNQFKETVYLCAKYTDETLRCWTNATIHGRCVAPACTNQARALVHRTICASPDGYACLPRGEELFRLMRTIARHVMEFQGANGAERVRRAIGAEVAMKNHLLHQRHIRGNGARGTGFVNELASPVCDADGPCGENVKIQLERFIQLAMSVSEGERGGYGGGGGNELLKHSFGTTSSRSAYAGAGSSFSTMKSTGTAAAGFELYGDDIDDFNDDDEDDPYAGGDTEGDLDDDDFDDNIIPALRPDWLVEDVEKEKEKEKAPEQPDAFSLSSSLPSLPPRGPQLKSDTSLLRYAAYIGRPSIDPNEPPHPQTLSHLVYVSTWPSAFLATPTGTDIATSEISMFEKIAAYHESFILTAHPYSCAICPNHQRATTFLHRPISFRRCARSTTASATSQNISDTALKSTIFNFQRYVRGPQRWTYPEIIATLGGTESHASLYCMVTGSGMDRPLPHVNDFLVPLCARNTVCEETARIAAAMFVERQVPVSAGWAGENEGDGDGDGVRLFPPLTVDTALADEMGMAYGVEEEEEAPRCVVKRVGGDGVGQVRAEDLRALLSPLSPTLTPEKGAEQEHERVVTVHDLRACLERSEEWSEVRKWVFEATGTQIMAVDEDGDVDENSDWETSSSASASESESGSVAASESHIHPAYFASSSSPSPPSSSDDDNPDSSSSSSSSSDDDDDDDDDEARSSSNSAAGFNLSYLSRHLESTYIDDRVYTYTLREPPGRTPFTTTATTTATPPSPTQATTTLQTATRTPATTTTWGGYSLSEASVRLLSCGAHEMRVIEPVLSVALVRIMEWGFLRRQMDLGGFEGVEEEEQEDDDDDDDDDGEEKEKGEGGDAGENGKDVVEAGQGFRGDRGDALAGLGISLS